VAAGGQRRRLQQGCQQQQHAGQRQHHQVHASDHIAGPEQQPHESRSDCGEHRQRDRPEAGHDGQKLAKSAVEA
jgi:hypothetical protein